jgi:hypothetical protein
MYLVWIDTMDLCLIITTKFGPEIVVHPCGSNGRSRLLLLVFWLTQSFEVNLSTTFLVKYKLKSAPHNLYWFVFVYLHMHCYRSGSCYRWTNGGFGSAKRSETDSSLFTECVIILYLFQLFTHYGRIFTLVIIPWLLLYHTNTSLALRCLILKCIPISQALKELFIVKKDIISNKKLFIVKKDISSNKKTIFI